jgi:hypothetical protein
MNLHSYPKIFAIGHRAVSDLFNEDVLVEEKVDGSQFSFAKVNGEIKMRSHGAEVFAEAAGMFKAAATAVKELAPRLHDGWTYRGEYLSKPKHNVLCYSRVPKFNIILFDINTGDEVYLSREEKEDEAERIGMEIVPLMYQGKVMNPEQVYGFLERESILGGVKVEGVVAKNYARFGMDKKVLMGKYVSEKFKETHSKEWKASNPALNDVIDRIVATLRSEARWQKAVAHLKEEGKLEGSPRDIGLLIQAAQKDIKDEEADFIQQKLYEYALPRIVRASTAGLPEWYKKSLLELSFTGDCEVPNVAD